MTYGALTGNTVTVSLTVNPVNDNAPVVTADAYTVAEGGTATGTAGLAGTGRWRERGRRLGSEQVAEFRHELRQHARVGAEAVPNARQDIAAGFADRRTGSTAVYSA